MPRRCRRDGAADQISRKWEFDVTAYRASDPCNEYVACEVKKTVAEQDQMVELMQRFSTVRDAGDALKSSKEINAFRKLKGLQARRASIFWALGQTVPIRYIE